MRDKRGRYILCDQIVFAHICVIMMRKTTICVAWCIPGNNYRPLYFALIIGIGILQLIKAWSQAEIWHVCFHLHTNFVIEAVGMGHLGWKYPDMLT